MTAACETGKTRYKDEIAAKLALATIRQKAATVHEEQRAYRCPFCRGWHLTSKPRRRREVSP